MSKLSPGPSFSALCGFSLVLWFRPLLVTFALAAGDGKYTQIFLILPLTASLILAGWGRRRFEVQWWTPAAAFMAISLSIAVAARRGPLGASSDLGLALQMAGLVAWWIASFVLCFGRAAFRSFRFPLFFLFWMVPIPKFALDPIVADLQRASTLAAQLLFWLFRVPVSREGTLLLIPGLDIDVTAECSSVRSSLMLLVTTMLLAHVLLTTPWRKVLVVVFVIPLSVAKNGLRIFTIGMLGTRVDPSFLTGRLHRHGGIVFFLIALGMMFLLIWILRQADTAVESTASLPRGRP